MPGFIGKIWKVIPLVVITVFLISWVEILFVLPAHLAHTSSQPASAVRARALHRRQQAFSALVSTASSTGSTARSWTGACSGTAADGGRRAWPS